MQRAVPVLFPYIRQVGSPVPQRFRPAVRDHYLIHCPDGEGTFTSAEEGICLKEGRFSILPGVVTFYQADSINPGSMPGRALTVPMRQHLFNMALAWRILYFLLLIHKMMQIIRNWQRTIVNHNGFLALSTCMSFSP